MLLHLSDPHFGTEQPEIAQALRALCLDLKPELVVVSGDLTQRARQVQFAAARDFLDSLGCPYLVVPGNHDIPLFHLPKRIWKPFHRYEQYFGCTESSRETEHFVVIGVNTIVPQHHTKGRISLKQIHQVEHLLSTAPAHKHKIVVTHQPFMVPPHDEDAARDIPSMMLPALHRWSQCGLNALLHGHLHQSAVYDLNRYFLLQQAHPILDIHAGTALSSRLRQTLPNSVNVISPELNVLRYDYQAEHKQFIKTALLWPMTH
jgi:3',5'-cyclic AMP phosphodiesterase CpdA